MTLVPTAALRFQDETASTWRRNRPRSLTRGTMDPGIDTTRPRTVVGASSVRARRSTDRQWSVMQPRPGRNRDRAYPAPEDLFLGLASCCHPQGAPGSSPRGAGLWMAYPQGPPCLFFPHPRGPRVNQPPDRMVWGTVFGVSFLSELIMSATRGPAGREGWGCPL